MIAHRNARRAGFTLMEVLAAMLLIGIVIPAVMRGVTISLQAANSARHKQEATMLAEQLLNVMLAERTPTTLSTAGNFGEDWPEYRWEMTSTATDHGLYDVIVSVYYQQRGEEYVVSLPTLIYPSAGTAASGIGVLGF